MHAAGLAHGEAYQGRDTVALAFIGDGATSEGDFHEGINFAAVFKAPVVYFVQNNRYAISVPLSRQTAAPSLAYKGVGYGVPSEQVDGNDPVAVLAVLTRAVAHARAGNGPFLVEAHTYRMEPHTNADDATATATAPRSTPGATATRSPAWRPTCARAGCSTTRPSPRSPSRPRRTRRTCGPG